MGPEILGDGLRKRSMNHRLKIRAGLAQHTRPGLFPVPGQLLVADRGAFVVGGRFGSPGHALVGFPPGLDNDFGEALLHGGLLLIGERELVLGREEVIPSHLHLARKGGNQLVRVRVLPAIEFVDGRPEQFLGARRRGDRVVVAAVMLHKGREAGCPALSLVGQIVQAVFQVLPGSSRRAGWRSPASTPECWP